MDSIQLYALELFRSNRNLFITGGAGVGKSFFVRSITNDNPFKPVIVTSTTGISAMLIGGRTIHSWSGVGMFDNKQNVDFYYNKIRKNRNALNTWRNTKCLVIDEISMMHPAFLDLLNSLAKLLRNSIKPFGGIQLILVGDFYQLPPIPFKDENNNNEEVKFSFEAKCWNELELNPINFTHIYRQNELELMNVLNKVRTGNLDTNVVNYLTNLTNNKPLDELYTYVFPTKKKVADYNQLMLNKLDSEVREYKFSVSFKPNYNKDYFTFPKDSLIEDNLILKKGCFVMCIFNLDFDSGIVNGTQGIVIDFNKSTGYPIVKFNNGIIHYMEPNTWAFDNYSITQIPLILAYSLTVHKMQGSSIEKLAIDIGKHIFECGQSYVALSRCTNSKYLHISSFEPDRIKVNDKVTNFYNEIFNYNLN